MTKYIDTLSDFGKAFQVKIIYSLIHDLRFLQDVLEILEAEYFESDTHQWIVKTAIEYYSIYKKNITMDVFSLEVKGIASDSFAEKVIDDLKRIYTSKNLDDLEFTKDQFQTFCKNQKIKQAIIASTDLLQRGDYDAIKVKIDEAMKAGMSKDIGHNWKDHVSLRLENLRAPTKTYMDAIDNITDGGLGGGELGVIVAPSGVGKCVGYDTIIDIEYDMIGITTESGHIIWVNPWERIQVDTILFATASFLSSIMPVQYKTVRDSVPIGKFFDDNNIPEYEDYFHTLGYDLKINTPYGYYKVPQLCRTISQTAIKLYFENDIVLECGWEHKLRVNGEWKMVSDIDIDEDLIETFDGYSTILKIVEGETKILYDLSVDEVHCFYGNGILSHNTWALCGLGFNAAINNFNVLHVTLELSADYVGRRYDTILTGKPFHILRDDESYLVSKLNTVMGNIDIKQFPTRGITVQGLEMYLEKVFQLKHIDLIILDYADLLGRAKYSNGNDYEDMGGIYEELRGMSMKFNVPIWTASQSNRGGSSMDVIGADSIADSYKKVMTADFIVSLMRKDVDKLENKARVHVIKNRFGPDGMTFDCDMNTNVGKFHVYDKYVDNKSVEKKQQTLEKKNLKSKYDSFKPSKDFG